MYLQHALNLFYKNDHRYDLMFLTACTFAGLGKWECPQWVFLRVRCIHRPEDFPRWETPIRSGLWTELSVTWHNLSEGIIMKSSCAFFQQSHLFEKLLTPSIYATGTCRTNWQGWLNLFGCLQYKSSRRPHIQTEGKLSATSPAPGKLYFHRKWLYIIIHRGSSRKRWHSPWNRCSWGSGKIWKVYRRRGSCRPVAFPIFLCKKDSNHQTKAWSGKRIQFSQTVVRSWQKLPWWANRRTAKLPRPWRLLLLSLQTLWIFVPKRGPRKMTCHQCLAVNVRWEVIIWCSQCAVALCNDCIEPYHRVFTCAECWAPAGSVSEGVGVFNAYCWCSPMQKFRTSLMQV